ncbi:MAG TPA: flavin reductase family protein [Acidimicrobiales bacterium]|nr:flavin reductase family protein [Acidimicrobiales bacterium]
MVPPAQVSEVGRALARVATNVAVVTTRGPRGCTANVWAEDPDPPVVLVTLRRGGDTHAAIADAGVFGVSLLSTDQVGLARRFAGPPERRFAGLQGETGPLGLVLLPGSLAVFECRVRGVHDFGAYDIVVGDVETVEVGEGGTPLVFADRRFGQVVALGEAAP